MSRAAFQDALFCARDGDFAAARQQFSALAEDGNTQVKSACLNNIGVLDAILSEPSQALEYLRQIPEDCLSSSALANIRFLETRTRRRTSAQEGDSKSGTGAIKVAIVSLLFNWPSTGGGTVHTKELAEFLTRHGINVRHIFARHDSWNVGRVTEALPYTAVPLNFPEAEWNQDTIRDRFRSAVNDFSPDLVIITDSWNTKPLLAEAVSQDNGYPYFLRIAAMESLCPLNNVRMLVDQTGEVQQCDRLQLADPFECQSCVQRNGMLSGWLHQQERALAGFDHPDYPDRLRSAFAQAEGVLVVNPMIAQLVEPYTPAVHVIPSGFDSERFASLHPTPPGTEPGKLRILFAGLVDEFMKGFHILQRAGEILWNQRQDFEIIATADPAGTYNEFTRFVGWQDQADLPQLINTCDLLVFPTLAQEALGRTAVEAMAFGKPVVASRLGGLTWVVEDQVTGLLCEPGNPVDLAEKLESLLNDQEKREQFGQAGRQKFFSQFTWDSIIGQHYQPLFSKFAELRSV